MRVAKAMAQYLAVYHALYQRVPKELRDLGNGWVLVNGARMRVEELELLTSELTREKKEKELAHKRSIVKKLLNWFSKA